MSLPSLAEFVHRFGRAAICLAIVAIAVSASAGPDDPPAAAEAGRFVPEPIDFDDRFDEGLSDRYQTGGTVRWLDSEVQMEREGALAFVGPMAPDFVIEFDIRADEPTADQPNVSQLVLAFGKGIKAMITIVRYKAEGEVRCQAVVSQNTLGDNHRPDGGTENVKATKPLKAVGDESWRLTYKYGVMSLHRGEEQVCRAYVKAMAKWLSVVTIGQQRGDAKLTRLRFKGETIGYTTEQRAAYDRSHRLMARSRQAANAGEVEKAISLQREAMLLVEEKVGAEGGAIGVMREKIGLLYERIGKSQDAAREYRRAYENYVETIGAEHPDTIVEKLLWAEAEAKAGAPRLNPTQMWEEVQKLIALVDPKTQTGKAVLQRFAGVLQLYAEKANSLQRYEDALGLMRKSRDVYKAIFGESDRQVTWAQESIDLQERAVSGEGEARDAARELIAAIPLIADAKSNSVSDASYEVALGAPALARKALGPDHPTVAWTISAAASRYIDSGQLDDGIALQREALEIYQRTLPASDARRATQKSQMGAQLSVFSRFDEAEPLLVAACNEYRAEVGEENTSYAGLKLELGRHLIRVGKTRRALKELQDAWRIYKSFGAEATPSGLIACHRLADALIARSRLREAEELTALHRQLVVSNYGKDSAPMATVLSAEANLHAWRRRLPEALESYEQAEALALKHYGKDSRVYESILHGKIAVHQLAGDGEALAARFEERLEHELRRRERLFSVYSDDERSGRTAADIGSLSGLLLLALNGDITAERAHQHALAFKGATTARLRSDKIAAATPESKELADELADVERRIAEAEDSDPPTAGLGALTERRDQLRMRLREINSAYSLAAARPTSAAIAACLPEGAVLVDYYQYFKPPGFLDRMFGGGTRWGLVAFVLTRDEPVRLVDLGLMDRASDAYLNWFQAIVAEPAYLAVGSDTDVVSLTDDWGAALRQRIWDPLGDRVAQAQLAIVSPNLDFNLLPFGALPSPTGDGYLVDTTAFVTQTTPRLIPELLAQHADRETRLLLVGDISFNALDQDRIAKKGFSRSKGFFRHLSESDRLVHAVRRVCEAADGVVDELQDNRATEAAFVSRAPSATHIHLDSHGFCMTAEELPGGESLPESEKLRSHGGVALAGANRGMSQPRVDPSDGVLWTDEIAQMDLHGVELVTFAACQSAMGDAAFGAGMRGPQRSLHVAGAAASLTALWTIEDRLTVDLMERFYTQLWREGESKAIALQLAQQTTLRDPELIEHFFGDSKVSKRLPIFFWSPFVLHGDWR